MKALFVVFRNIVFLVLTVVITGSVVVFLQQRNEVPIPTPSPFSNKEDLSSTLTTGSDLVTEGDLVVKKDAELLGSVTLSQLLPRGVSNGYVLSIDSGGRLILVTDQVGEATTNYITTTSTGSLPTGSRGGTLYHDGTSWLVGSTIYYNGGDIGIYTDTPAAAFHVENQITNKVAQIVQGASGQTASLTEWRTHDGVNVASIDRQGKLSIRSSGDDHSIELYPTGDAGYLSSSGGAFFIDNTDNIGSGIGIYSNAGSDALGNMINIKVDNAAYAQAAFYMNYDGTSNAVEIVSNSSDTSSNALSVTGNNENDSTVGIIGYETGRGTLKITHNGTGSDDNASGLSIDLAGTGTDAQGIYVDSTASGGTDGNLLRLRNETLDRFVVSSVGSLSLGRNGTNTSITKYGNTSGDEFFVGTNGAFRVQRSATDSEAFRTQISGDTQGRWLGTSDGKLKFGDGSSAQDVVLQRTAVGLFQMDTDVQIESQATSNTALLINASDGSALASFAETSGGAGTMSIANAAGTSQVVLAADGTNSYFLTGNLGLGTSSTGTDAANVFAFANGTPPSTSITDGVQLFAQDVVTSELRVRDEAGNVTTLSPHNFSLIPNGASEDLAWSYYSERDGSAINVDMLAALRTLENISGVSLVYQKNLITGEVAEQALVPSFQNTHERDEQLKTLVAEAVSRSVTKQDFEKHVAWTDSVWKFLQQVVFNAKAIFTQSVEFLANATFRGTVTVNANTAGLVTVPPNASRFQVTFKTPFEKTPVIYVTSSQTEVLHQVSDITEKGFAVTIKNPLNSHMQFQWLALLSESGEVSDLTVLETIPADIKHLELVEDNLVEITSSASGSVVEAEPEPTATQEATLQN